MQIVSSGDNLHEIPNSVSKKNKKNISICRLLKIVPRVLLSVKMLADYQRVQVLGVHCLFFSYVCPNIYHKHVSNILNVLHF